MTETDQEFTYATLDKIASEENFDECTFKIEQALSLIFGEVKKVCIYFFKEGTFIQNNFFK